MLLAKHSVQQVAGLSVLPNLISNSITRVVGKFKPDQEYEPYGKVDVGPYRKDMEFELAIPELEYRGSPAVPATCTKLPNGVTAVCVDKNSAVVSLGVYCGVGARNESRDQTGMVHVLKNNWFGSTTRRTIIGGYREPIQCGVDIAVSATRELFGVTASCTRDKSYMILDHMTQNLVCPEFFDHEIEEAKKLALLQTSEAMQNADVVLLEEAHKIAYRNKGLGNSLYYRAENSANINRQSMLDFYNQQMRNSNNLVFVGCGMDLDTVSSLTDEFLWSIEGGAQEVTPATFTGMQERHIETGGNLTKALYLSEGAATGTHEALVLDLVKHIVGGSASSPIKRGTLNNKLMAASPASHLHTVHCVNYGYSDSGMFGLSVTAHSQEIGEVLKSSVGVISELVNGVSDEEMEVAKNKLKHALITERDSTSGILETSATDSLLVGAPNSASQLCTAVDNLTKDDVIKAAKKTISSSPILVSIGNGDHMPLQRELR